MVQSEEKSRRFAGMDQATKTRVESSPCVPGLQPWGHSENR